MERYGVEQIPEEARHGRIINQFTLWFASNLTVADYALGAILVTLGLGTLWVWIALIVGNVLGAFLVGVLASYGPEYGLPQMMVSKKVFGNYNVPFSLAQWVSTLGWFSVNAIISGYVLYFVYPAIPLSVYIFASAVSQAVIAYFGYDIIHKSEHALSYVLGAYFALILILALLGKPRFPPLQGFNPVGFAVALATVFSYIMSWAPYASDYSRYLPQSASKKKIIAYVTLGGAIASAWMEVVGMVVSVSSGNFSGLPTVLISFSSKYWILGYASVAMIFLGSLSANVLNIYSNSLSLLSLTSKIKRDQGILIGATIGTALAIIGGINFVGFFEGFLYFLDYWITPWIGVMIVSLLLKDKGKGISGLYLLISYAVSLLISAPFMNLEVATSGLISYVGPLAEIFGGADISYFVSFAFSIIITYLIFRFLKASF